jgi:hypothetical protein
VEQATAAAAATDTNILDEAVHSQAPEFSFDDDPDDAEQPESASATRLRFHHLSQPSLLGYLGQQEGGDADSNAGSSKLHKHTSSQHSSSIQPCSDSGSPYELEMGSTDVVEVPPTQLAEAPSSELQGQHSGSSSPHSSSHRSSSHHSDEGQLAESVGDSQRRRPGRHATCRSHVMMRVDLMSTSARPREDVRLGTLAETRTHAALARRRGRGLRLTGDGGYELPVALGDPHI